MVLHKTTRIFIIYNLKKKNSKYTNETLPQEIIDNILVKTTIELGIILNNQYTIGRLYQESVHSLCWACQWGHINMVKWLFHHKKEKKIKTSIAIASERGYLDILKFIYNIKEESFSDFTLLWACGEGHLDIVKWYYRLTRKGLNSECFDLAVKYKQMKIVRFLEKKDIYPGINGYRHAAENGDFKMIKWLYDNVPIYTDSVCLLDSAVRGTNLELIKWLVEHKFYPVVDAGILDTAASTGKLEILKYLYEISDETYVPSVVATREGHLHIIKWLYYNKQYCNQRPRRYDTTSCEPYIFEWSMSVARYD